jgi:acyl-[acyl-carrier-protein]-phospholipid O-acyltransferase/long-chain-fatty-acid--[acyl-carrier-protein] ligase
MGHLFKLRGFLPYVAMLFLNAFVDLGHKIVIQNTVFKVYDGQTQIVLMAIVNALILLPFIMLFTPAGYIGDKYPKPRVMRVSAWVAVGLTILITLFYYQGWFWPAFAMTFLLAMQSAFYSPAKYGYIRELVGKNSLAAANGIVQAATTVAILSGIFVFSMIFEFLLADKSITTRALVLTDIAPIGYFLILGALVEVAMAYRLPQTQETDTSMHFDWRKYRRATYIRENLATVTRHETILLSIIGLSIFWSISQVMIAAFPAYAEVALNETNTVVIQGILA